MIKLFSFSFSISVVLINRFPFILVGVGNNGNPFGQGASYARSYVVKADWMNTSFAKEIINEYRKNEYRKSLVK